MPLKHFTETFLVILLGFALALTGLVLATLPDLPQGSLPVTIVALITIAYPLLLLPLFRRRRADYSFRVLHFFPAFMVLAWVILQAISFSKPEVLPLLSAYEYVWVLPGVALGFTLLAAYCLHVVRRRSRRIVLLLLIFVPFVASAFFSSEQGRFYDRELAATLWAGDWWDLTKEGRFLAGSSPLIRTNLDESQDSAEEQWRERLRSQRRREERIAARLSGEGVSSVAISSATSSSRVMMAREEMPGKLTKSGPEGYAFLGLLLAAAYTGTLHTRARNRA